MIPSIILPNSITAMVNGKTLTTKAGNVNFNVVRDYLKSGGSDPAKLAALFDTKASITVATQGKVVIKDDTVFYDGQPLHTTLTARMIAMLGEGFDIAPLTKFLEKLMQNPSRRAVQGLYDFLAATNIPITPEGNFLAYKKVRNDYLDIHSGTIRNAPGDAPRVARNQVDEDPDRTCSHGLHVCSESYLGHFGSHAGNDRIVIVEVNPADVVAIPRDYNNAKMRCCGYTVIGEVTADQVSTAFNSVVMGAQNFASPAPTAANTAVLTAEETDVIRDIHGTPVRFFLDEDGDWQAEWTDSDGDDRNDVLYVETLDEAVEDFIDGYVEEIEEWEAEVRWLDEDAELQIETVTVEFDGFWGDEPEDDDFLEKAFENCDWEDGAKVANKRKTGTKQRVG